MPIYKWIKLFLFALTFYFFSGCNDDISITPQITTLELISEYSLQVPEPSGLSLGKNAKSLWTVSDAPDNKIYEMDLSGNIIQELSYEGSDLEGIVFDSLRNTLFVVDETKYKITEVSLSGEKQSSKKIDFDGNGINGFEGVCIDNNSSAVIANEKDLSVILKLNFQYDVTSSYELDEVLDISGLCFDASSEEVWGVSDESKLLFCWNSIDGIIKKIDLPYEKMEGLAIDFDKKIVYMVNDRTQKLYIYKLKN
jgi:uncharacterized protein YjiK